MATSDERITQQMRHHTRHNPCRVCESGQNDRAGRGTRCHGWDSTDGHFCFCSREEYAVGDAIQTAAGPVWRHDLGSHSDSHPATRTTSAPPKASPQTPPKPITQPPRLRHPELGTPTRVWEARAADGALMALHARFERTVPGQVKPAKELRWWRTGWSLDDLALADVPLYGLPALAHAPADVPVWLVEGEKAADALQEQLRGAGYSAVVLATYGASAIPSDAQLAQLLGHGAVTLWPDPDPDGRMWARVLTARLAALRLNVRLLTWPDAPPKGDAVEYFAAGGTVAGLTPLSRDVTPENPDPDGGGSAPGRPESTADDDDAAGAEEAPQDLRRLGWEARARNLEILFAQLKIVLASPDLEAGEKVVQMGDMFTLHDRGATDGKRSVRTRLNDWTDPKTGEIHTGYAKRVCGMTAGTVGKHRRTLKDLGGVAIDKSSTTNEVTGERHSHVDIRATPLTFNARLLVMRASERVRTQKGGARPGAGRPALACGSCGSHNTQEEMRTRTKLVPVKVKVPVIVCRDCGVETDLTAEPPQTTATTITEESNSMIEFSAQTQPEEEMNSMVEFRAPVLPPEEREDTPPLLKAGAWWPLYQRLRAAGMEERDALCEAMADQHAPPQPQRARRL